MDTQPSTLELLTAQQLLQGYDDAQPALDTLAAHNGDLETSFDDLWAQQAGTAMMADPLERKTLHQVTLEVLRQESCGDDSFRTKLLDFNKNPTSATALTGLIVYVATLTTLPINPAIARCFCTSTSTIASQCSA